jgi:CRP/FNR family transcriptional regulator, cyclic AMP receptor protein
LITSGIKARTVDVDRLWKYQLSVLRNVKTFTFWIERTLMIEIPAPLPSLLSLLPKPVVEAIESAARLVRFEDGQWVHNRGDGKPGLSIVKSGAVLVGSYGPDGSFLTTSVLGPGHSFGEFTVFANLPRSNDISAEGSTEIWHIAPRRVEALCARYPELALALLKISLLRSYSLIEQLDDLRRLPLDVRTAKFLLQSAVLQDGQHRVHLTQTDLAFALGVSRVSVSKVLTKLAKAGLVELGYGKLGLPQHDDLCRWLERRVRG